MNPFEPRMPKRRAFFVRLIIVCTVALLIAALAVLSYCVPYKTLLPAANIAARKEGALRLHFLGVGQGDCTIVEFPTGELLVIDAGDGAFSAEKEIVRCIKALDPTGISLLATHADADHYGGLIELLSLYEVKKVYLPVLGSETARYGKFTEAVAREGCETEVLTRYSVIADTSGAYLVCISPYSSEEEDDNDSSAVLYLNYRGVSALLCGDIGAARERLLMREYAIEEG
ncbi:MAG: MBL fold metallo-hydrolase, partial [Clostridia bacterium]|nr:MBL fold metallo-hydrolase [Clostridia bacterium]